MRKFLFLFVVITVLFVSCNRNNDEVLSIRLDRGNNAYIINRSNENIFFLGPDGYIGQILLIGSTPNSGNIANVYVNFDKINDNQILEKKSIDDINRSMRELLGEFYVERPESGTEYGYTFILAPGKRLPVYSDGFDKQMYSLYESAFFMGYYNTETLPTNFIEIYFHGSK